MANVAATKILISVFKNIAQPQMLRFAPDPHTSALFGLPAGNPVDMKEISHIESVVVSYNGVAVLQLTDTVVILIRNTQDNTTSWSFSCKWNEKGYKFHVNGNHMNFKAIVNFLTRQNGGIIDTGSWSEPILCPPTPTPRALFFKGTIQGQGTFDLINEFSIGMTQEMYQSTWISC